MLDLECQKDEFIVNQCEFCQENENCQYIENVLWDKNKELVQLMEYLKFVQDQLFEFEWMVLLGGLVVGIVYDVNMLFGVGVIVVSFFNECLVEV